MSDQLMIASLAAQQQADFDTSAVASGLAREGRGVPGKDFCAPGVVHMPEDECDCGMDEGD